jgi:choline kinase
VAAPATSTIVLAAGLGSRLRTVQGRPKWLAPLGPRTVADHQLDGLHGGAGAHPPLVVVAGAHEDVLRAHVADYVRGAGGEVDIVSNDHFSDWNNWYSLLLGLQRLDSLGWDGPTRVVNADLVCPGEWFDACAEGAVGRGDIVLAVDVLRPLTDEAMKVTIEGGEVRNIGKTGLSSSHGEYIGLTVATAAGRAALADALEELGRTGGVQEWYEGAFRELAFGGFGIGVWETPHERWVEVDDDADLGAATVLMDAGFGAAA